MKRRQGIIIVLILLIGVLFFVLLRKREEVTSVGKNRSSVNLPSSAKKETMDCGLLPPTDSTESAIESKESNKIPPRLAGQNVTFTVSGELKKGEVQWKEGTRFHFNDFICKIDETKLFVQISEKKERLRELGIGFMQDCSTQFPDLTSKWERYFSAIDQGERMPLFPLIDYELEMDLLSKHGIDQAHDALLALEQQIERYYYLAPFDGKIISLRKKIGARVEKGEVVLVIQKGSFDRASE